MTISKKTSAAPYPYFRLPITIFRYVIEEMSEHSGRYPG